MGAIAGGRPLPSRAASRAERLAERLHPHRVALLIAGFGAFVLGMAPLAALVHGLVPPARWHATWFAASVPLVLWAFGAVVLATFFHPTEGLVGSRNRDGLSSQPWLQALARAYAALTVWAFGLSPVVVLGAAAI